MTGNPPDTTTLTDTKTPPWTGGVSGGGDEGIRTPDLYSAIVALSQLSYVPAGRVGLYVTREP